MTDTSERERQINEIDRAIAAAFGALRSKLTDERWRRADAETIRQLRQDKEEIINMLRDVSDNRERYKERCAAQSAELERVRKEAERYRAQGETMRLACNKVYAGIAAYLRGDIDKQALTIATDAFYIALAAPPAAGGEKEG